jgi:AcrR family transcriptional regulator
VVDDDRRWGSDARRAELLTAARRVVARRGAAASMDELAAEAGITKPVLYRYFGDRSGLYRALAEEWQDEMLTSLIARITAPGAPNERRARSRALLVTFVEHVDREPGLFSTLANESSLVHELTPSMVLRSAQLFGSGPDGTRPLDPEALERALPVLIGTFGFLVRTMSWWLTDRRHSVDEITDIMLSALYPGLDLWIPSRPDAATESTNASPVQPD